MDQTKIWSYFQNEEAGKLPFNAQPRYDFLAKHISAGTHALNIGAGRGGLEATLINKGVQVSTLDPDERTIARLSQELGLGNQAKSGYSQAIPFPDRQFDVVIMSEVLEHLSDEVFTATMSEVRRVLKPGGQFIGTVPADEHLLENLVVCPHCGEQFHRWGHVQSFSQDRLRAILVGYFMDVRISRVFFGVGHSLNWKGRLGLVGKRLLMGLGVKGSGESYFFSASVH